MLNVLIAESEELESGGYEVIGVVSSETEARELAVADMAARENIIETGIGDPGICPYVYTMFSRSSSGDYRCTLEIPASEVVSK